jgi:hypothetical protein
MPTRRAASAIAEPEVLEAPEVYENVAPADPELAAFEQHLAGEEAYEPPLAGEIPPASETRLTGDELLSAVESWKAERKTIGQMAFSAGYVTVTKDGQERVLQAAFNKAILEAQGHIVGGRPGSSRARANDGLSFARVTAQGQLLVSQLATREIKAQPGAVFTVEFPEAGAILLRLTDEIRPVTPRKKRGDEAQEQPGTPLLDGIAAEQGEAPAE